MESKIHDLKTWPGYFSAVYSGKKSVEIRKYDRDFKVGDVLLLREWVPETQEYTGRECKRVITHIFAGFDALATGYAALSMKNPDLEADFCENCGDQIEEFGLCEICVSNLLMFRREEIDDLNKRVKELASELIKIKRNRITI